jgi:CheY-like chemotaxis protein
MTRRALLIDDDESIRFVLRNALAETGWQVTEIDDGCEAEAALAARRYDLVVLDLYMPGMNGFEVLRRLRRDDPAAKTTWKTRADVPVMVVSGQAEEESLSFASRIGADACLTKPFEIANVQRLARELEGKPRAPKKVNAATQKRGATPRR